MLFRALVIVLLLTRSASAEPDNPSRATIEESLSPIQSKDLLRIVISEGPSFQINRLIRVEPGGLVRLPYLEPMKLTGQTPPEAERTVVKAYQTANVIRNALVSIARTEAGERVKDPGGPAARGDLLQITVGDLAGANVDSIFTARIAQNGTITLPHIGSLKAADLTEAEIEKAIAAALIKQNVIQRPQLSARLLQRAADDKDAGKPLTPGDLLQLTIYDLTGPGVPHIKRLHIGSAGEIGVPHLPPLKVQGLEESAAMTLVVKTLTESNIIQNPIVDLFRLRSAADPDVKPGPLAPGDIIRLTVIDLAGPGIESSRYCKLDAKGQITCPLLDPIAIDKLEEATAEQKLARAYREANIIQNAVVGVLKVNGKDPLPDTCLPTTDVSMSKVLIDQPKVKRSR